MEKPNVRAVERRRERITGVWNATSINSHIKVQYHTKFGTSVPLSSLPHEIDAELRAQSLILFAKFTSLHGHSIFGSAFAAPHRETHFASDDERLDPLCGTTNSVFRRVRLFVCQGGVAMGNCGCVPERRLATRHTVHVGVSDTAQHLDQTGSREGRRPHCPHVILRIPEFSE
jgi:hypothetical protein